MQNDVLPDPLGPLSKQLKECFNFRFSPMKCWAVTRLSPPELPLYLAQRNRRMVINSPSLEEGYSITIDLGLCHYIYCCTCPPLAFDLMFRLHVNIGFALFQNYGPDYLEIHQFCIVIIYSDTSEFTNSFSPSLVISLYA